jgi:modulator of FtsH protease
VAVAGAGAALAGLLFVAMSINVKEIIAVDSLPPRAIETLTLLVGALLVASVGLLPDLSDAALGASMVVVTGVTWAIPTSIRWRWRGRTASDGTVMSPSGEWLRVLLVEAATLPGVIGSVMVMTGNPDGLYLVAVGILVSFVVAVVNAWVLLVEILR